MSQPSLSILGLGLSPSICNAVSKRLRARGIDSTSLAITDLPSVDAEIARIASSKNWNGLMIGYGVRNDREWFDRLIQVIHDANPNIPLIHHEGPDDVENAIERHFNIQLPPPTSL